MSARLDAMRASSKRGDSVRRVDYCGAVAMASNDLRADEIGAYATADGRLRLDGVINTCDCVYTYEDADGNTWGELRVADEVLAPGVLSAWQQAPLTDDHPDVFVTPENWTELVRGHLGSNVRPNGARTATLADIAVCSADLIVKVEAGKKALSCGYQTTLVEEEGELNGIPYSFRQTAYVPNHVSVVDVARGPGCEFVIDGVRSVRSRPQPNGDSEMKKKPTDVNATDAKIMIPSEVEVDVPDEAAKLIADLQARIAELEAGGGEVEEMAEGEAPAVDADVPMVEEPKPMEAAAAAPAAMDAARKSAADAKTVDAMAARLAFLEAQNTELRDSFSGNVDARVKLISKAREVLGDRVELDGKSDGAIKRAIVIKISPSMKSPLDGKSADYLEAAYTMALDHRAKTMDSSGKLLALTGHATIGKPVVDAASKPDLNKLRAATMDSLRNSTTNRASA